MSAYEDAVDATVEAFDKFHRAVRQTNRSAEKLAAAEVDFLNDVDEQRGAYQDAMLAFERMRSLEPKTSAEMLS